MRVDENGKFTGQWLFDQAILPVIGVDTGLSGADMVIGLDTLFSDARQADEAIGQLLVNFPRNNGPRMQISIGMPYIDGWVSYFWGVHVLRN